MEMIRSKKDYEKLSVGDRVRYEGTEYIVTKIIRDQFAMLEHVMGKFKISINFDDLNSFKYIEIK